MIKYLFLFLILTLHGTSLSQAATSQEIDPEVLYVRIEQIVWHTNIEREYNYTSFNFIATLSLWNPAGNNIEYVHANYAPLFDLNLSLTLTNTLYMFIFGFSVTPAILTTTYAPGVSSLHVSIAVLIENYTQDFLPTGLYMFHLSEIGGAKNGNPVIFYNASITITNDDLQIMFDPVSDQWGTVLFPSKIVTGFLSTPAVMLVFAGYWILLIVRRIKK